MTPAHNGIPAAVLNTILKFSMLDSGDHVLIGLSGGADSVCLTHILSKLRDLLNIRLSAVYINHNLRQRQATSYEESFVKALCFNLDIDFGIKSVDVSGYADKFHVSIEEAGRILRHEVFKAFDCDKIALAHHADDVAETVLLNLFRGSGIKGTAGIPPVTVTDGITLIRPLYGIYRKDVEDYLAQNGLAFCLDQSNLGNAYTRNRIRNSIIPLAKDGVCARANRNVYAYAKKMRMLSDYINLQCAHFFDDFVTRLEDGYLIPDALMTQTHAALHAEVILYTIGQMVPNIKNIGEIHINDILSLYKKGRGKYVCLPSGLYAARVKGGVKLYLRRA